ncbi:MAG TPA: helix-turn-helix domain-containing protein [Acidimicrobiia bacterium]|nr:helix-turn-helix domain-containing protein [Acidimicrobiia bacterium]HKN90301.1 helix-turn-helix domain-containing protein [Acidimicrobiia bacterium]
MAQDPWRAQLEAFGSFVRTQRQLAKLSLRELAELATVSNPYLSQIERGLHEPSIRVIKAIANALDISTETLLAQVGLVGEDDSGGRIHGATEAAISADPYLTDGQREALLAVYRSYVAESRSTIKRGKSTSSKAKATPPNAATEPSSAPEGESP